MLLVGAPKPPFLPYDSETLCDNLVLPLVNSAYLP